MRGFPRATWVLLALLSGLVSCSDCSDDKRAESALRVRWPVSLDETKTPATVSVPRPPSAPSERPPLPVRTGRALLIEEPGPGVRVREGTAHDIHFLEVVFGDADFDDALPLVVLLHGRGDRPRLPGGPFASIPISMRLIIPQAPVPLGEGFTWISVSITHNRHDLLAAQLRRRADHLAALINTLKQTRPTLGRPIVAGFSQGGMLSFTLALHRPDAVGFALPNAGWVPPDLMPTEPVDPELRVPIRAVHGSADPIVPMKPTEQVMQRLGELGWDVEFVTYAGVEHVMSPAMNEQFESWLEDALEREAPILVNRGLGERGPEIAPYEPYEPLDDATQEAIREVDCKPPVDDDASDAGADADAGAADAAVPDAGPPEPEPVKPVRRKKLRQRSVDAGAP